MSDQVVAITPKQRLDPFLAAEMLGVKYLQYEQLAFNIPSTKFEVAGLLIRKSATIAISRNFSVQTQRFTGAHEIGHWLLHPGELMHRDRPVHGIGVQTSSRPPHEREADYFAACFLVPESLLADALEFAFLTKSPFVFDDAAAFHLSPKDPDSVLRPEVGSLARALALASAESYAGRHFHSLASQFGVSVTMMAIRLHELKLIA